MASDAERYPVEDTVIVDADELAARGEDWPVAELYRVEPDEAPTVELTEEQGALAITEPVAPGMPRRVPAGFSGALLAILGAVTLLILAAALLTSRDDGQPARASEEAVGTALGDATTTDVTVSPSSSTKALPDLEGMKVADARQLLEDRGLRVRITDAGSGRARGVVLGQDPAQGAPVRQGDTVALTVSRGSGSDVAPSVGVPSVVGLTASDAVVAVRDAGFVAKIRLVASTGRGGLVVRQSPRADAHARRGSTVRLDVAKARAVPLRVEVPDLVGSDAADARRRLAELGLTVAVVRVASAQPAGVVLRQSPAGGTRVVEDGRVTLTVSSGPQQVDVPDVTGLGEQAARAELDAAGFDVTVSYEPTSDPGEDGLVRRQTPVGATTAAEGSEVTIVVAQLG